MQLRIRLLSFPWLNINLFLDHMNAIYHIMFALDYFLFVKLYCDMFLWKQILIYQWVKTTVSFSILFWFLSFQFLVFWAMLLFSTLCGKTEIQKVTVEGLYSRSISNLNVKFTFATCYDDFRPTVVKTFVTLFKTK